MGEMSSEQDDIYPVSVVEIHPTGHDLRTTACIKYPDPPRPATCEKHLPTVRFAWTAQPGPFPGENKATGLVDPGKEDRRGPDTMYHDRSYMRSFEYWNSSTCAGILEIYTKQWRFA